MPCREELRELEHKVEMLQTVNNIALLMLQSHADIIDENIQESLHLLAELVDVDRVYIWKNYYRDGIHYCAQRYEWSNGVESQWNYRLATEASYNDVAPRWEQLLSQGYCINDIVRCMPESEQAALTPQGILSILVVPIFLQHHFWGFLGFDDCRNEQFFPESDEIILRSASEMIAGALSRVELEMKAGKLFYDSLTGIYNRRFFDENMPKLHKALTRSKTPLTLMMIDIDNFKRYNDIYGHVEGDSCLKEVAEALRSCVTRTDDFVARYGGEEFVAIMPNTDEAGALTVAQRMLEKVRELDVRHMGNPPANIVTVSIGITTGMVEYTHSETEFVMKADEMLYESKRNGRNQYTFGSLNQAN
ncbi:MAG: sensor domain-containing diguanylate cyclase [Deferribacteraceae bacterium]|jgi:diguanylate cyclase (GGDEF)-like protein|nr:sensor domain-containing diguanylate cyclase [Deferribacteraceae bacterium]